MREEYSDRKLFFGMALRPQNRASPSSATSAMMWRLRSIDHSLRASEARSACAAGIMREPGRLRLARQRFGLEAHEIGNEQEQSSHPGSELVRSENELANIGDRLGGGADGGRTLLIEPPWQRGKTFGSQHLAHRRGAQRRPLFLECLADLVD